jgi:hypothetical protein
LQVAQSQAWDISTELIAQAVDLLAVLAADKRTKGDPHRVPRPDYLGGAKSSTWRGPAGGQQGGPPRDPYKQAIDVLRSTSRAAYVTNVPVAGGAV